MPDKNTALRNLPSVSALLETEELRAASARFGQTVVSGTARQTIETLRNRILHKTSDKPLPTAVQIAHKVVEQLELKDRTTLQPVLNATGILLHTGLGRAPLAESAAEAADLAARGYCNVELDLVSGQRSQRSEGVADLLCQLTGAEAAHVVNNNAGATALVLAALATNREVVISHGELIEIGGGFRLPDVIETFGARLRPVGTTNKTRPSDYENAIGDQTGALLVVHPSNYSISGFTQSPPLAEIVEIARRKHVPLVHDIGSGAMIDFAPFGCQAEPVATASVLAGADLVLFSGDKLLGGPQAGIIVGGRAWIDRIVQHPLNRALRVDKITLAALRATLQLYRQPDEALRSIPLLRFLQTPAKELKNRAEHLAEQLRLQLPGWQVEVTEDEAFVGGGSVPGQAIASWSITFTSNVHDVSSLARQLRLAAPAVVGRVQHNQLILCLHCIFPEDVARLSQSVLLAANKLDATDLAD